MCRARHSKAEKEKQALIANWKKRKMAPASRRISFIGSNRAPKLLTRIDGADRNGPCRVETVPDT
jgi:hypothetical protein